MLYNIPFIQITNYYVVPYFPQQVSVTLRHNIMITKTMTDKWALYPKHLGEALDALTYMNTLGFDKLRKIGPKYQHASIQVLIPMLELKQEPCFNSYLSDLSNGKKLLVMISDAT